MPVEGVSLLPRSGVRRQPVRSELPVLRWRLLRDEPHTGARNMAVDHALAECVEPGEGVLRLYRWSRPTLSLGRNEPAGGYSLDAIRAEGMDVVRRPTGGRAVLHDAELTYAVVAPLARARGRAAGWGARAAYRAINEALAAALRSLGAPVGVAGAQERPLGPEAGEVRPLGPDAAETRALSPDAGPCFRSPAAGEVIASGRKLVGSAQARIGGALLQHGSILLAGSQPAPGAITLSELVPDVSIDEVAAAVAQSLRERLGGEWSEGGLRPSELEAADRLERERYLDEAWTLRR